MGRVILMMCLLVPSAQVVAGMSGIVAANNQVSFRHLTTNVDYFETGNGRLGTQTGILNSETGPVRGMSFAVSAMREPGNQYYFVGFDRADGYTTYTGAFMGGVYGSVVGLSVATLTDLSGRIGKGLAAGERWMLTPYAEIGHHQWYRGVNFGEIYTHYHLGGGLLAQFSPVDRLALSANMLLGRTVLPNIAVNGWGGFPGFSGGLGTSRLSRIGVAADYAFTARLHGSLMADYTRFQYGISGVYPAGGGFVAWEPDSSTRYFTVKVGVGAAF